MNAGSNLSEIYAYILRFLCKPNILHISIQPCYKCWVNGLFVFRNMENQFYYQEINNKSVIPQGKKVKTSRVIPLNFCGDNCFLSRTEVVESEGRRLVGSVRSVHLILLLLLLLGSFYHSCDWIHINIDHRQCLCLSKYKFNWRTTKHGTEI